MDLWCYVFFKNWKNEIYTEWISDQVLFDMASIYFSCRTTNYTFWLWIRCFASVFLYDHCGLFFFCLVTGIMCLFVCFFPFLYYFLFCGFAVMFLFKKKKLTKYTLTKTFLSVQQLRSWETERYSGQHFGCQGKKKNKPYNKNYTNTVCVKSYPCIHWHK